MAELPFQPPSETLRTILRRYLSRAANWLLSSPSNASAPVLAQQSNSNWEAALTLTFLADVREIFSACGEEAELCELIPQKSATVVRWLLDRQRIIQPGRLACWDNVTWDTAVVTRAILRSLLHYPDAFNPPESQKIQDAATASTAWLYHRFNNWEAEVKYPFGPSDVAQILITALFIHEKFPRILQAVDPKPDSEGMYAADRIAEYLLHVRETGLVGVPPHQEEICYWEDFFQTSEVLDALALYYRHCEAQGWPNDTLGPLIEAVALQAFRYFENSQQESGMWGTHVDTMRTLYAYVKVSSLMPNLDVEPHLVFKALRWICDEKQCFEDGSFLHTMFLTIFMCETLAEVYKNWKLADKPVYEIYDDVLWAAPVRTTPERTKRFAAEIRSIQLGQELDKQTAKHRKFVNVVELATLGLALAILTLVVSARMELTTLSFTFRLLKLNEFLAVISIGVAVYLGLGAVLVRRS